MNTVQPPMPLTPGIKQPTSLPILTVPIPPSALTELPKGSTITARVTNKQPHGQTQFETALGTFLSTTKFPLKAEMPLLLRIGPLQGNGALILTVLEIAGKPLTSSLYNSQANLTVNSKSSNSPKLPPNTPTNLPIASTSNANFPIGLSFKAKTVTSISVKPMMTIMGESKVTQGDTPRTKPISPSSPSMEDNKLALQFGLNNGPLKSAGDISVYPAGRPFTLTIQSISHQPKSDMSNNTNSIFTLNSIITGHVVAHTRMGQPIIQTVHGSISLNTIQNLLTGTEVTIKVDSIPDTTQQILETSVSHQRHGMIMSEKWSTLSEVFNAIQTSDPTLAHHLNTNILPKPDIRLTSTALFFLSALRGGDVRSWIGESTTRHLERIRPDLSQRLTSDFRILADRPEESAQSRRTTDWRGTLIPFMNEGTLEQIRLFTRTVRDDDDSGDKEKPYTRFLVEITLTNIGRFQLDGIIDSAEKRLDMIVRTAFSLPNQVRSDLVELFKNANGLLGMRGGMAFRSSPDVFVEPNDTSQALENGVGIIV